MFLLLVFILASGIIGCLINSAFSLIFGDDKTDEQRRNK